MPDFFLDGYEPNKIIADHGVKLHKPKTETTVPASDIQRIFSAIESNLSPELVTKTQAVFQFNVTGIFFNI